MAPIFLRFTRLPASIRSLAIRSIKPFHSSARCLDVYKDVNLDTFTKLTQTNHRLVLVDFYADWCGPCHQLSPILEKLCSDPNIKSGIGGLPVDLIKVDVESDVGGSLGQQHKVTSLPTVFAYREGKPVSHFRGAIPQNAVLEFLKAV
ncbi:hypothetical protein AMATHDRAFT_452 [Amanita thiersii Skay4041]|uniref:Thioredoxin domain-containing protein n=1 Tax=Amanita thiersii Skay4041 TaxID=703135 RepID=A0A2A9NXF0_9AGAR|nr:hypothetical protein AMATHDRAFT_452 [Amanita thiersii Skay4041]